MKVKDFLAYVKSLELDDDIKNVYELEMILHPSVKEGSKLIWVSMNDRLIYFSTKETLL